VTVRAADASRSSGAASGARERNGDAKRSCDTGLADGRFAGRLASASAEATAPAARRSTPRADDAIAPGRAIVAGVPRFVAAAPATGAGFTVAVRIAWSSGRAASTSATASPTRGIQAGTILGRDVKAVSPRDSARQRRAHAWHMPSENSSVAPRHELTP